jgi:predicted nucleotidyltransferase
MDKNDALNICKSYLLRLKKEEFDFADAWMFGSFAKGDQHDNSDIDLAIILSDQVKNNFDTEVQLMIIRTGEETIIEPHAFTKDEFNENLPLVNQIVRYGERIIL